MGRRRGNRTESVAIVRARLNDLEPINGRKPFAVFAVDSDQSLSHLAATILLNFGFEMDHCYGFYSDTRYYTRSAEKYELFADIGEAEGPGVQHVSIKQVFSPGRRMLFLFDYTHQWHFVVRLERYEDAVPGQEYPALLRSHAIPLDNYYVKACGPTTMTPPRLRHDSDSSTARTKTGKTSCRRVSVEQPQIELRCMQRMLRLPQPSFPTSLLPWSSGASSSMPPSRFETSAALSGLMTLSYSA